jgi:hypothetical protein
LARRRWDDLTIAPEIFEQSYEPVVALVSSPWQYSEW